MNNSATEYVLTEYILNDHQLEQLKNLYVETIVDSMSMEDLRQFAIGTWKDDLANFTLKKVLNEIKYTLDEEMLEEFITDIKNDSEDKMQQNDIKNVFKCYFKCKCVFYLLLLVD